MHFGDFRLFAFLLLLLLFVILTSVKIITALLVMYEALLMLLLLLTRVDRYSKGITRICSLSISFLDYIIYRMHS